MDLQNATHISCRNSHLFVEPHKIKIGRNSPEYKREIIMATFTNRATLTYNGRTVDSNTVTGTINEPLTVTKNALSDTYSGGGSVTYVISLVNSGTTTLNNLTVTDDLGSTVVEGQTIVPLDYVGGSLAYFINGTLQSVPSVTSESPLIISGISVPAGGDAFLVYQAMVTPFAGLETGDSITNTVTVNGSGLAEGVSDSETITVLSQAELSITKALNPTTVIDDGAITYTFEIENRGNTATLVEDNVTVTDVFDPILNITSVTLDGVVLTAGVEYTYDQATGNFSTTPGFINVPAATFVQNPDGSYTVIPGSVTLEVNGTIV